MNHEDRFSYSPARDRRLTSSAGFRLARPWIEASLPDAFDGLGLSLDALKAPWDVD